VQQADAENLNWRASGSYVQVDIGALRSMPGDIIVRDWESERGRHVGDHVADLLIRLLPAAFEIPPVRHRISIVVPALDEARTIGKVLDELVALRLPWSDVAKEILVVDGGSTDGTLEIAGRATEVRVYSLPKGSGRGAALRYGFARARGNVVVVYPSDGEYFAQDLPKVVAPIMKNEFKVVFGSRAIKCLDLGGRLQEIYGADRLGYGLSKYGGTLISLACMFLHSRYISDPLTSFKAFDAELLRNLNLEASGVELEGEIIANLSRQREFILEVPVDYVPRNRAQGKKIRTVDGLRTLWLLIRTGLARRWTRARTR
jgi:glycosyltransferase involved in cell wall biosynthesis